MSSCNHRYLRQGELLFEQGAVGESAFLLKEGCIEVSVDRDGERTVLAELKSGDLVGEMAIVDGGRRSAHARALTDTVLFEFTREQFDRRLGSTDPIVRMVLAVVLQRMRKMLGAEDHVSLPLDALKQIETHSALALSQLELERDLGEALASNSLTLFYQPIIDLNSGRLAGFEALVRWYHPTRGLLGPGHFIPMAEATGLITDLTRWAIREACTQLPDLAISALTHAAAVASPFVSVNVSANDLIADGFAEEVEQTIRGSGIEPSSLKLEITESTVINNLERSIDVLSQFRALGVGISIDDFGTGYSSLASLGRLPLDTLKIDRAFVTPLDVDASSHRIVNAIIQLADMMQFDTVAEGIETAEQRDVIRLLGGHYGQGYLFGRPAPLKETLNLICDWDPKAHGTPKLSTSGNLSREKFRVHG